MRVGVIRVEQMAVERVAVLQKLAKAGELEEVRVLEVPEPALADGVVLDTLHEQLQDFHAVFVGVPGVYTPHLANAALKAGVHIFLGRSAVPSLSECTALAALAEEAGVEVGLSRIMRFHPFLEALPAAWRTAAITLHHSVTAVDATAFQQMLEDAVDLCCSLAGTGEVRKIEAQLVQRSRRFPVCLLVGIRFQNGTYAHVELKQGSRENAHSVYAGGGGFEIEADFEQQQIYRSRAASQENEALSNAFDKKNFRLQDLIATETIAFLASLRDRKPVPISIMDGLQTLRLVENIRKKLR
ncbi:MAG: hypothetical protein AAF564_11985 [Bacteroidota bacterium]